MSPTFLYENVEGSEAIDAWGALILAAADAKNNVVALRSDNKVFMVWNGCLARMDDQGFPDSSQPVRNFVDGGGGAVR